MKAKTKLRWPIKVASALVFVLLASGCIVRLSAQTKIESAEKSINLSIEVNASIEQVWNQWLTPKGINKFFAPACQVDPVPLGDYNIYFLPNAKAGQKGAEGNHIMAIQDKELLSFTWDAPPQWPEIRKQRTLVVLRFYSMSESKTIVTLTQSGWGTGEEWDAVYNYFTEAWGSVVLPYLKYSLEVKPVDWSDFPKNLPQGLKPAQQFVASGR